MGVPTIAQAPEATQEGCANERKTSSSRGLADRLQKNGGCQKRGSYDDRTSNGSNTGERMRKRKKNFQLTRTGRSFAKKKKMTVVKKRVSSDDRTSTTSNTGRGLANERITSSARGLADLLQVL